eukprot:328615-Chlamydomonas_euryale.AAC.1
MAAGGGGGGPPWPARWAACGERANPAVVLFRSCSVLACKHCSSHRPAAQHVQCNMRGRAVGARNATSPLPHDMLPAQGTCLFADGPQRLRVRRRRADGRARVYTTRVSFSRQENFCGSNPAARAA